MFLADQNHYFGSLCAYLVNSSGHSNLLLLEHLWMLGMIFSLEILWTVNDSWNQKGEMFNCRDSNGELVKYDFVGWRISYGSAYVSNSESQKFPLRNRKQIIHWT